MSRNRRKVVYISLIIFIAAVVVQLSRVQFFESYLVINQKFNTFDVPTVVGEKPAEYWKILTVVNSQNELEKSLLYQLKNTIKMTHIPAEYVEITDAELGDKIQNLSHKDLIVMATEDSTLFNDGYLIEDFVKQGGHLAVVVRGVNKDLNLVSGVIEDKGYIEDSVSGLKFESAFFPGLDKVTIENQKISNSIIDVQLDPKVHIIATAKEYPLIWEYAYGAGKTIYINSTLLNDKANRGVLLQSLLRASGTGLATIINAKILNIDDYPAPIKPGEEERIEQQYSMDNHQFYRHIWLGSIINMAQQYRLKLTGLAIGTYNDKTVSPLPDLSPYNLDDIKYYGRRLTENGGELGIHGYNHQSLALKGQMAHEDYGYSPWASQKDMEEGLSIVRRNLEKLYGNVKFYTYVAPSNIVSLEGKKAVKNVFPELKVYAGLYTGAEDIQGVLYQEFGEDPDIPGTWDFPRLTAGYHYNRDIQWDMFNGIATWGIFNHFIHPDDILDDERSQGMKWTEMEKSLRQMVSDVEHILPGTNALTDFEAANYLEKMSKTGVWMSEEENEVTIHYTNYSVPMYHYLKLDGRKIESIEGGSFKVIDEKLGLYWISGGAIKVSVKLK